MPTATFSVIDIDWMDGGRQRAVPTRLYWPRSAMPRTDTALTFEQAVEGKSQVVHALDGFVVEGRSAQTADHRKDVPAPQSPVAAFMLHMQYR
jgi:hypothetical protein